MSLGNMIVTLKRIRFFEHEDDSIEVFEETLNEIAQTADTKVIIDLCSVFHDEIDEPSMIGDLIETIFYIMEQNRIEEGLSELIKGISRVLPQARYCAKRLYKNVLDTEDLFVPYINALRNVTPSKKAEVIMILKEISDKHPKQYSDKVNFILKEVSC
ncbi:hypothetical protein ACEOWJ_001344 [Bacillus cereus]|uniref:Imm30 family immunity protein n=1 Tax=Bacillus TaxID=1386 RepID=UPI000551EE9C|nr:Imm30 family immunity protein [Bacillus sp. UNC322MFChir4.1]